MLMILQTVYPVRRVKVFNLNESDDYMTFLRAFFVKETYVVLQCVLQFSDSGCVFLLLAGVAASDSVLAAFESITQTPPSCSITTWPGALQQALPYVCVCVYVCLIVFASVQSVSLFFCVYQTLNSHTCVCAFMLMHQTICRCERHIIYNSK